MKARRPAPPLRKLIGIMHLLTDYRADIRANLPAAVGDRRFMFELSIDECTAIIELIETLRTDPNILGKYWLKGSGMPRVKPNEKLSAVTWIAWKTSADDPPDDEMFEQVGDQFCLTGDQVKHAYRKYLLPSREPRVSKNKQKVKATNT